MPIETASRELLYKLFLSHHLACRGFRCFLGSKSYINYLIERTERFLYFDKGYHEGNSDQIYKKIKKNRGLIISLDEEGGVDYSDNSTLLNRYSESIFNNSDLTFLWGQKQYNLVKKRIANNTVVVSGHPRFELLKSEFQYLYKDDVLRIKEDNENFILVNTNMSFGNNIRGESFVIKNYGGRFKKIKKIIQHDKDKLQAYKLLVLKLSQISNKNIILRPHPEENHSFYLDAFKEYKNIKVINEGSAVPWILAADIVIHPDCTTAIESLFTGKIPQSFLPKNYSSDLTTILPLKASNCFLSDDELISYIKKNNDNSKFFSLKDYSFAEDYFSISKSSMSIIVNEISKLSKLQQYSNKRQLNLMTLFMLKWHQFKKKITFFKHTNNLSNQKLHGLNISNIFKLSNMLVENNKQFQNIKINKITNQLFSLEQKF